MNKWIRDENEKRMAEAEALRAKLEREKQELRDFLEQGIRNHAQFIIVENKLYYIQRS